MSNGITIIGVNASGKTTFGKQLADLLGYKHMDIEDYSLKKFAIPYANPCTREEMRLLLLQILKSINSLFSEVNCDFGDDINVIIALYISRYHLK